MKKCKHSLALLTIIWTKEGERAHPCKKCGEIMVFGSVRIKKNNEILEIENAKCR